MFYKQLKFLFIFVSLLLLDTAKRWRNSYIAAFYCRYVVMKVSVKITLNFLNDMQILT